jgi:beta-N-acetylhexosaminidase
MANDPTLLRLARAALLPAFGGLDLGPTTWQFLEGGGRSVLLGESREEYVRRSMDDDRVGRERPEQFTDLTRRVTEAAGRPTLVAIDQELAGIQRLHRLVRPLPTRAQAGLWSAEDIVDACAATSDDVAALGVNLLLSPVLDVPTGFSPWLYRRDMASDALTVAAIGASYIRGIERSGRVAATAKHFPGHGHVPQDPALEEATGSRTSDHTVPFVRAIEAGVSCVMTGAALVPEIDDQEPSSTSGATVGFLRSELGFDGLVISDDLDEPSIARGRSVPDTAVASLRAGVDLLLVAGGEQVEQIAVRIADAVAGGELDGARLEQAAGRVDALAVRLAAAP